MMSEFENDNNLEADLQRFGQWCEPRSADWATLADRLPPQEREPVGLPVELRRRRLSRRVFGILAVAAATLAGVIIWNLSSTPRDVADLPTVARIDPTTQPVVPVDPVAPAVVLAAGCRVAPVGSAEYSVLEPRRVRLDRGQLDVEVARGEGDADRFVVETPAGSASAVGTRFFVQTDCVFPNGSEVLPISQGESSMKSALDCVTFVTKVLVVAGVVQLVGVNVNVEGRSGQVLAAEANSPPLALGGRFSMLGDKAMQDDIMLTDEQLAKLRSISAEKLKMWGEYYKSTPGQGGADAIQKMSIEERQQHYKEMEANRQKVQNEISEKVKSVLLPHQLDKIENRVVRSQLMTLTIMRRGAIEKLNITPEQKEAMRKVQAEMAQKQRNLVRETEDKVFDLLTPEQVEMLKKMSSELPVGGVGIGPFGMGGGF